MIENTETTARAPKPFLKWAEGKRQLLPQIRAALPATGYTRLVEPFVGAGGVVLSLAPEKALLNDSNEELINVYTAIRDDLDDLVIVLGGFAARNDRESFLDIRGMDRVPGFAKRSSVVRAARTIYLNKTAFNGLFRVNKSGQFNTPFGDYSNPVICDVPNLRAASAYLNQEGVEVTCGDYHATLNTARPGDLVYLDPPYASADDRKGFTAYTGDGFSPAEQQKLRDADCGAGRARRELALLERFRPAHPRAVRGLRGPHPRGACEPRHQLQGHGPR